MAGVKKIILYWKDTQPQLNPLISEELLSLVERTHAGIARAKSAGKRFGRPPTLNDEQKKQVLERIQSGITISAIAREFNTTRQTILRVKARQQPPV